MKRSIVVLTILGLLAGAIAAAPADAKKKKKKKQRVERAVEATYSFPSAVGTAGAGACSGCVQVASRPDEHFVKIEIEDDNLAVAGADFAWDTDGDDIADKGFVVCGATDGFVKIPAGVTLVAFTWPVTGPDCTGGGATSGTITATFSNKP